MSKTTSSEYSYSVRNNECIVLVVKNLPRNDLVCYCSCSWCFYSETYYTLKQCCATV